MSSSPTPSSALLNAREAALYLNIATATIRAWTRQKKIPVVRVGGRLVRFRRSSLERFIIRNERPVRQGM